MFIFKNIFLYQRSQGEGSDDADKSPSPTASEKFSRRISLGQKLQEEAKNLSFRRKSGRKDEVRNGQNRTMLSLIESPKLLLQPVCSF